MEQLAPPEIAAFQRRLLAWYAQHGRHDLPWRTTRDPYAIYVSEVMLQQTQVATVLARFYHPFLQRFPTFASLAGATLESVLGAWQGMGYYRRARHLHAAARQAGGVMPQTLEGLMALPGVGRNTAQAVAAFAYRLPVAVMEANVKRVLCRLYALTHAASGPLWQGAEALLNRDDPFGHNQAMMDLGAMICTPRNPRCGQCPAQPVCRGAHDPHAYPAMVKKRDVPVRVRHIVVRQNAEGKIQATARAGEFLHGLYGFDEREQPPGRGALKIGDITQHYSHFTLEATVYLAKARTGANDLYSAAELARLPMSMAEKKILRLLAQHGKKRA